MSLSLEEEGLALLCEILLLCFWCSYLVWPFLPSDYMSCKNMDGGVGGVWFQLGDKVSTCLGEGCRLTYLKALESSGGEAPILHMPLGQLSDPE